MAESRLSVDRLILELPGWSAGDGQRLARRLVHELALATPDTKPTEQAAVKVDVSYQPGQGIDRLAEHIVSQLLRQLGRS